MKPFPLVASIALTASSLAAQIDGAFNGFTWSQEGSRPGAALGWDVAVADVSGNGDWRILSPERSLNRVAIFDARAGALITTVAGPSNIGLGEVLASGDTDGDGRGEFIVGSRTGFSVLDGDGNAIWSYRDPANAGEMRSLDCGDLDGDGYGDVIVGRPFYSPSPAMSRAGQIEVVSGRTRQRLGTYVGPTSNASTGFRVEFGSLGGAPAVFASAPAVSAGTGEILAFDSGFNRVYTLTPGAPFTGFGSGFLVQQGDLLAIGSPGAGVASQWNGEGRFRIQDLRSGMAVYQHAGTQTMEGFGASGTFGERPGIFYATSNGPQFEGVFHEIDFTAPGQPVPLFQGDPGTRVGVHHELVDGLFGDRREVAIMTQPGAANPLGHAQAGRIAPLVFGDRTIYPSSYRPVGGQATKIDIDFGAAHAGKPAFLLGSATGPGPTTLPFAPNLEIALAIDWLTPISPALFQGLPAVLDGSGKASVFLLYPPIVPIEFHCSIAGVVLGQSQVFDAVSIDATTLFFR